MDRVLLKGQNYLDSIVHPERSEWILMDFQTNSAVPKHIPWQCINGVVCLNIANDTHMEATLNTVQQHSGNLNDRLLVVETDAGRNANRVDQLEAEIKQMRERLKLNVPQGRASNDGSDARRCISFKGFNDETASERVKIIGKFFKINF